MSIHEIVSEMPDFTHLISDGVFLQSQIRSTIVFIDNINEGIQLAIKLRERLPGRLRKRDTY